MSNVKLDPEILKSAFGDAQQRDPEAATRGDSYEVMAGFVPPRVKARFAVTGAIDPTLLSLQVKVRDYTFATKCFDEKTKQLMIFGIMLGQLNDAAKMHAIAARPRRRQLGGTPCGDRSLLCLPRPACSQSRRRDAGRSCDDRSEGVHDMSAAGQKQWPGPDRNTQDTCLQDAARQLRHPCACVRSAGDVSVQPLSGATRPRSATLRDLNALHANAWHRSGGDRSRWRARHRQQRDARCAWTAGRQRVAWP